MLSFQLSLTITDTNNENVIPAGNVCQLHSRNCGHSRNSQQVRGSIQDREWQKVRHEMTLWFCLPKFWTASDLIFFLVEGSFVFQQTDGVEC